jgi:hypothetical protein
MLNAGILQAQEHNSFALGVNYTQRLATGSQAHADGGIGFSWRVGHSNQGWGWTYGLGWFENHVERSIGARNVQLGDLTVRPLVGGYGYTHQINKRWFVTADLVGGVAFTTLDVAPAAAEALGLADGNRSHFRVIPIVRPELKAWYDLNNRWGLTIGGWYAFARPTITVDTLTARETFHLRADTFSISTGIVYRIF